MDQDLIPFANGAGTLPEPKKAKLAERQRSRTSRGDDERTPRSKKLERLTQLSANPTKPKRIKKTKQGYWTTDSGAGVKGISRERAKGGPGSVWGPGSEIQASPLLGEGLLFNGVGLRAHASEAAKASLSGPLAGRPGALSFQRLGPFACLPNQVTHFLSTALASSPECGRADRSAQPRAAPLRRSTCSGRPRCSGPPSGRICWSVRPAS